MSEPPAVDVATKDLADQSRIDRPPIQLALLIPPRVAWQAAIDKALSSI
jgi:hypothetical protein